jgi:hypothetical protein
MIWIPTRSKFIQFIAEAYSPQNGVHRPPKAAKFGGYRWGEKFKKLAKSTFYDLHIINNKQKVLTCWKNRP